MTKKKSMGDNPLKSTPAVRELMKSSKKTEVENLLKTEENAPLSTETKEQNSEKTESQKNGKSENQKSEKSENQKSDGWVRHEFKASLILTERLMKYKLHHHQKKAEILIQAIEEFLTKRGY